MIDPSEVAHFSDYGWVLTDTLDAAQIGRLPEWADEIAGWPEGGGGWLHHKEQTESGPALCRSENLIPFHNGLRDLLTLGRLPNFASRLLGEQAVLYKEKINYKQPGGAGYAPHQDAPAYPFVDRHVSAMVAVDDATVANGCLEVVSGAHHDLLDTDETGCIRPEVVEALVWDPVEVQAGQTLWFHSRAPHRSGSNTSSVPRRALYPTYNALSEGDLRENYYREKLATFAGNDGDRGRVRVSLIGDFQGAPVT